MMPGKMNKSSHKDTAARRTQREEEDIEEGSPKKVLTSQLFFNRENTVKLALSWSPGQVNKTKEYRLCRQGTGKHPRTG